MVPLGVFDFDVLAALGLQCEFSFDYANRLVALTLLPLTFAILLGFLYVFVVLAYRPKTLLEASEAQLNVSTVPRRVLKGFQLKEVSRLTRTFVYMATLAESQWEDPKDGPMSINASALSSVFKLFGYNHSDSYVNSVILEVKSGSTRPGKLERQSLFRQPSPHRKKIRQILQVSEGITFPEFLGVVFRSNHDQLSTPFSEFILTVDSKINTPAGQNLVYVFLLTTFLVLVGASTSLFEWFQCITFHEIYPPESYLIRDYSIDCTSSRYKRYMVFAFMMIIVSSHLLGMCPNLINHQDFFPFSVRQVYPIGIPLLYFVLLRQHRDTISDQEALDRERDNG